MNSNTTTLIVLVLVLVLCCGPMLWMMMRGKPRDGKKRDHPNNGKQS